MLVAQGPTCYVKTLLTGPHTPSTIFLTQSSRSGRTAGANPVHVGNKEQL